MLDTLIMLTSRAANVGNPGMLFAACSIIGSKQHIYLATKGEVKLILFSLQVYSLHKTLIIKQDNTSKIQLNNI